VSDKIKDGGPAFPVIGGHAQGFGPYGEGKFITIGMSLRDYFAAKAMQSLICEWPKIGGGTLSDITMRSYQAADAMLEAREK
jgi:hypothetical protein